MNGCDHTSTTLSDVPKSRVRALARVGDNTAVIWQDEQGRPLVRLGRVERFTQAPTAPLFEGPAPRRFEVSASLSTGHSWLLFVKLPELKLIQLYSDGKLQALSPAATSH